MIHRALLGSMERFAGILIEHHAGRLPLWLAPVQALVLPVADRHNEYAREVADELREAGIACGRRRAHRSRSGGRSATPSSPKAPYMLVVGDREQEAGSVSVRHHGEGDLGAMAPGGARRARLRSTRGGPDRRVYTAANAGHRNHAAPLSAPCPLFDRSHILSSA